MTDHKGIRILTTSGTQAVRVPFDGDVYRFPDIDYTAQEKEEVKIMITHMKPAAARKAKDWWGRQ